MQTDFSTLVAGARTCIVKRWLGPFRRRLRELRESQWWDADRLRAYQFERLRITLTRAYRDVPFYRRWFDAAGFCPSQLADLHDLRRFANPHETGRRRGRSVAPFPPISALAAADSAQPVARPVCH